MVDIKIIDKDNDCCHIARLFVYFRTESVGS